MSAYGGDSGMTSHPHDGRVSKAAGVIDTLGEIDELNAVVGLLLACLPLSCTDMKSMPDNIQKTLFCVGSCESGLDVEKQGARVSAALPDLERALQAFDEETGPLAHFIIPGGHPAACTAQVARTVGRRAERAVVAMADQQAEARSAARLASIAYLNRLSTFLFALARVINKREGFTEAQPL